MTEVDPVQVREILALAIGAAGTYNEGWEQRVIRLAGEISVIFDPHSKPALHVADILANPVITGTFQAASLNSNSKRVRLIYQADHSRRGRCCNDCEALGPGIEHIWSERTDEPLGAIQAATIKTLRKGHRIRVWKKVEQRDPASDVKYRTIVHIARADADEPATVQPSDSPTDGSPPDTGPAPVSGGHPLPGPSLETALERLTPAQKVRLAQIAKEKGILDVYTPRDVETKDQILVIIEQYFTS